MKHLYSIEEKILNNLPNFPGVYKFIDENNNVLYVGKAKNLNKRIRSYFNKTPKQLNGKLKILLSKTKNIEYIVTNNENEAFLLENNLIKSLKPKYNVLLKDDKTFPWIKITDEEFPRIIKTRVHENDGSKYYGPYSSVNLIYNLLELIQKLCNIRTCKLKLTENSIKQNKYKPCLEFYINNCKAPCSNKISISEYRHSINLAEKILKGDLKEIKEYLKERIEYFASKLEYEKAHEFKLKLDQLTNYQAKTIIVNPNIGELDVFSIKHDLNYYFINFLKIKKGRIIQSHNLILEPQIDETESDIFLFGIKHIRDLFKTDNKTIIVPFIPNNFLENIKFIVPKSGDKLKLLKLSQSNLDVFVHQYKLNKLKANYGNVNVRLLEKLKSELKLKELPVRIECFDISHHAGSEMVGSCVVFVNAKPSKSEYRYFNIKTVAFVDDFAAIEEIIYRRYHRLKLEQKNFPHLVIIDGGKGQLSSALNALNKLNIYNLDVIAIAKKLEEIYKPNDPVPLYLDKRSESLKLIQRIRNEAHRFAISFHRKKKLKTSLNSILDTIDGIGIKTKNKLLENFTSINSLANADINTLEKIVGLAKAKILHDFFQSEQFNLFK